MRRQITLDTETTGLRARDGHRIIELGCVEIVDRRLTGNDLHVYLDPERDIDAGATAVHGITIEQLRGKPKFADVAARLVEFCRDAEVIIHNAEFDVGFLDAELQRVGLGPFTPGTARVTDSLLMAREMFPGKRNSLDALCERLMVPNAHRTVHGALLDATLLAEVYLAMTRGQGAFSIDLHDGGDEAAGDDAGAAWPPAGLACTAASADELAAHAALLDELQRQGGRPSLWRTGH